MKKVAARKSVSRPVKSPVRLLYCVVQADADIDKALNTCCTLEEEGKTRAAGMTYEQGVKAGIEWLTTIGYPHPTED